MLAHSGAHLFPATLRASFTRKGSASNESNSESDRRVHIESDEDGSGE